MKKILFAALLICYAVPAFAQQKILKGSTAYPLQFLVVDSADGKTGKTGCSGSMVVKIRKNGGSSVTPTGALSEPDSTNFPGTYQIAGNATDTNTDGLIELEAYCTGSDHATYFVGEVVEYDPRAPSPSTTDLAGAVWEVLCSTTTTTGSLGKTVCDRNVRAVPRATAFEWPMRFTTALGAAVTSGTPSCTKSIDAPASFGATTNSPSAVSGLGISELTVSTADTTGSYYMILRCTLSTAVDYINVFKIQP